MKTLLETFYTKNSDFCTKNYVNFLKNPNKTQKNPLRGGFLGIFFGFYWAGFLLPTLL
jgi:hypothetical protein